MQVSVENGEGLERCMKVDLPPEQIEGEMDKRLREFARSARLPGFRPGQVPVKILRQRYGKKMQQGVMGDLEQSAVSPAITQENRPTGRAPTIEPEIDQRQNRYAYKATFEVLPTFELASLEGMRLKRPVAEVTDGDVDSLIERLREQRKTWEGADRPARDGDKLKVSFAGTIEGEPFEGGSAQDVEIVVGSGRMIPGFESGLIGAVRNEERTLDVRFPDDYPAEHLRGKPASFAVTVAAIEEPRLPAVDAEFAKAFGVEDGDLERFRKDVRGNMERELKQRLRARIKANAMDLLLETNQIDLPRVLIQQEIRALKDQTRQGAGGSSIELPDSLFEENARKRVALGLIIAEVVKANGIEVDPERVREAVVDMASTYEQPQEVIDFYYQSKEHLSSIESLALEDQVVDWVMSQVTVDDETSTFQDVTAQTPTA